MKTEGHPATTPDARTYADLFTMNYRAIRALFRDVSEDEARRRPDGRQNPMSWIAGHVAVYRAEAVGLLGGAAAGRDLKPLFGKDVRSDPATWPPLAEVLAQLAGLQDALAARLLAAGDSAFEKTTATPAGVVLPTIVFLHFHETYHLGQLGYVRTWLGKSPLVAPG
jgi:hypothetical protein